MGIKKPLNRIALILFLIILLPALFFSSYEINSLNENEKVIQSIYNNQLEAILFSANLYSEDIASSWAAKLNSALIEKQENPESIQKNIDKLLSINPFINNIIIADSIGKYDVELFASKTSSARDFNLNDAKKILTANEKIIRKLISYKKGGYSKFETIQDSVPLNLSAIMLVLNPKINKTKTCIIIFNPNTFIKQILSPRVQSISQEKFIITVLNNKNNKVVYSTEETEFKNIELQKALWLLPDYSLGIKLKGETIAHIVKSRSRFNFILIITLNIILMIGLFLAYRSIRKEIELAQIKSDFVSNVSHELRTPLALISMFAETLELERARTEEKKKEYYKIISQEANRLGKIVNKILNFSKMEAGKLKYNFGNVDLNQVVEDIYNTYSFHIQNNGFKFLLQKGENLDIINADKEAVSEAIVNLIDNAVKYSVNKKEIILKTGFEKDMVYFEVQDYGIGISKEDQKKIFDKFYRVTTGNVHNTKGTGLGLSLVKYIVDTHKGKITIDSSLGEGSSFKIYFPVKPKNNN